MKKVIVSLEAIILKILNYNKYRVKIRNTYHTVIVSNQNEPLKKGDKIKISEIEFPFDKKTEAYVTLDKGTWQSINNVVS